MFQMNEENFYYSKDLDFITNEVGGKRHYHGMFEIYFLLSGHCTYFIDNKTYQVSEGDLVLIPGGTIHNTQYPMDTRYSRMLVNCSNFFIPGSVFDDLKKLLYVYHNDELTDKIREILTEVEKEYNSPDKHSLDYLQSLIYSLFILIARYPNTKSNASVKNEYIEKAVNHIRKNYMSKLSLNDVARVCSITPEHLSRIFKKETGFGYSEYLNLVRLQQAEYLIKNKELTITEIAHRCGFEDSNYFSFIFKKKYGISPREMNKQERI